MSGVSRRAWARNTNALSTVAEWNTTNADRGHVTVPNLADHEYLAGLVDSDERACRHGRGFQSELRER